MTMTERGEVIEPRLAAMDPMVDMVRLDEGLRVAPWKLAMAITRKKGAQDGGGMVRRRRPTSSTLPWASVFTTTTAASQARRRSDSPASQLPP
jgi:hypothetical protein